MSLVSSMPSEVIQRWDAVRSGLLLQALYQQCVLGHLLRVLYHYWYHIGESMAIRQLLGHEKLPQFVGDPDGKAPYRAG